MTCKKYNILIYSRIELQIQFYLYNSKKSMPTGSQQQEKVSRLDLANLETTYDLINDAGEILTTCPTACNQ